MSEWSEKTLSDLGHFARGKSKYRPRDAAHLYGGPYPFVQTGDVKASKHFITEYTQTYSEAGLAQSKLWPVDTLCITIAANIAETGILTFPACFPDSVIGFSADPEKSDVHFVEYLLQFFRQRVQKQAIGSVQDNINLGTFERFKFNVPEKKEVQTCIAEVLLSLDEKIELNRKQNRTLEAIAQALFKRWFVEFEFPFDFAQGKPDENGRPYKSSGGAMQSSELGEIPVGWEVGCIGDFVEHKKDGINPSDQPDEVFFHFSIPNFDDGQAAKPELGGSILSNKYLVAPDSILVSKLNPRFPRIWPVFGIPGERSVCSTEFQVLSPVEGAFGFVLCLLKSPLVASEMVSRASGTSGSHQRINPDDLLSIEVIKPAEYVIECFHLAVLDGIRKAQANLEQNRVLGEVRDTLLPKLMSGELRVGVAA